MEYTVTLSVVTGLDENRLLRRREVEVTVMESNDDAAKAASAAAKLFAPRVMEVRQNWEQQELPIQAEVLPGFDRSEL